MSIRMMARACAKCKKYVVIHPENVAAQLRLQQFERDHVGHMLLTVNLEEIKGSDYSHVDK